jgi:hypothetical protein
MKLTLKLVISNDDDSKQTESNIELNMPATGERCRRIFEGIPDQLTAADTVSAALIEFNNVCPQAITAVINNMGQQLMTLATSPKEEKKDGVEAQ